MVRAELDKQPHDVARMFDLVAERYDLTNDVLSLGQDRRWRAAVVRAVDPAPGQLVLDLADKLDDLSGDGTPGVVPSAPGADHAVRALVSLGVAPADADKAVREALADGAPGKDLASLIRDALGRTRK